MHDELVARVKELEEQLARHEWQPIETAPDSGFVDIYAKRFNSITQKWEFRRFTDVDMSWTIHKKDVCAFTPTHWMPIPKPQEAE